MAPPPPHPQTKKIVTNPFVVQNSAFLYWNAMSDVATVAPCRPAFH